MLMSQVQAKRKKPIYIVTYRNIVQEREEEEEEDKIGVVGID